MTEVATRGRAQQVINSCYLLIKDAYFSENYSHLIPAGNRYEKIEFQNMPESLSESKAANFQDTEILGRSEPIHSYSNSSPRAISLELQFVASKFPEDDGQQEYNPSVLLSKMRTLRSLVYPHYTASLTLPPPKVVLSMGNWLKMVSVVKDYNIDYQPPWTVGSTAEGDTGLFGSPMMATVSLSLEESNDSPFNRIQILDGEELKNSY